jgi:hypothetical protein
VFVHETKTSDRIKPKQRRNCVRSGKEAGLSCGVSSICFLQRIKGLVCPSVTFCEIFDNNRNLIKFGAYKDETNWKE